MEEYKGTIRSAAFDVDDLIHILQAFPPNATVWIGSNCDHSLDVYEGTNERGEKYILIN
jgi:hypothetical protein